MDCYAAGEGEGEDAWEGGLEVFGFEGVVEREEQDFPLRDLSDHITMRQLNASNKHRLIGMIPLGTPVVPDE